MRIGVVGGGITGRATTRAWLEFADEVRVHDVLPERRTHSFGAVLECDVIFLHLPEGQVEGFLAEHAASDLEANYVLCSTVPIGTTRRLRDEYGLTNLVHSPCFVTARCAVTDAQTPARNVIGYPVEDWTKVPAEWEKKGPLYDLYEKRFPGVPIYTMTSDESELLKLTQNAFFAVKVAFFNEARSLCDKLGLGWETVREALLADGRIHPSHTAVPGPDGKMGYGGACLPKDTEAFRDALYALGLPFDVSQAALMRNVYDRGRVPPK